MNQVFTIYSGFFLATALVSFFVAFLAWQQRLVKGARELSWLMIAAGLGAFCVIFETASLTPPEKIFWSKLEYFGGVATPVLYLIFVLRFAGKDKYLTKKNIFWLFIIPIITLILVLTNERHNLIWSGFSAISGNTNLMEYYHGPGFWIGYLAYNYLLLLIATIYLFRFIFLQTRIFRFHGWVVLIGGVLPWSSSVIYLTGTNPVAGLDLVPVTIVLSGVLMVYVIFFRRFLDLVSVARETLLEILPDGILVLDARNRIQDINVAAMSFLGLGSKHIIGFSAEASGASVLSLLTATLNQDPIDHLEIQTNNGIKIFRIVKQTIKNQPGSRLIIISDITDQVARQRERLAVEERYRHMFNMFRLMADNMPDLLWAKDLDNKYIFTNKAICETLLHATDTNEPIGKTDLFFTERERQKYPQRHDWHTFGKLSQDSDQAVISSLKSERFDEYGNVNGKFLFLDVRKAPILDENGALVGVVGSARDVTAQKKSVSEIYKRDRLLDAISKATALLVQGENLDQSINGALKIIGNATEVNRVYIFRNYDYPGHPMPLMSQRYEWTDGSVEPLIDHPELQEVPYEIACPRWFETLSAGNVIVGNIREFPEAEKTTLIEQGIRSILITPVIIDKKLWGFLGFDDCQIERNWTSTEERLLAAAANTIGAAYLRKINQDELIAAKEKAEESERLKSAFLANMSHEIRTPMNGILGFAGLLKEPRLTGEEQQEYISIIEKSGARMLNIINDIISISKVESGQMKVSVSKTNINEQIEYIHTFFSPEAMQKGIQLFFKNALPDKEAIIVTDKEKIYAVLTNLVKNAIKFTHTGAIEFGYLLKTNVENSVLEFFVKDTGLGIREAQQEFIFERFRQGNEMLNRNYEGAGLGLSISKAYVEMLGGKIWVESGEGLGSVFYFTIPYIREPELKTVLKNIVLAEGEVNRIQNLKILIAENDTISEKLIIKAIEMFGTEILKVRNGVKAVEMCRNHPDIDLVMMDIKMPEMDGYEATRQIRQFNTDIVIIAQTAFALAGDKEKAIAAGCNDYISKPINQALLISLMKKHF